MDERSGNAASGNAAASIALSLSLYIYLFYDQKWMKVADGSLEASWHPDFSFLFLIRYFLVRPADKG